MSTGIIHILNKNENGDTTIKVVYKGNNGPYAYLDCMHDITVTLGRYYNRRRIKKYLQVVVNRKRYFDPYLGTRAIGPIKAIPTNNWGSFTYFNKVVFA